MSAERHIFAVLTQHAYDTNKSHHWRLNYLGDDIVGRWACSCGATGTPVREWGGLAQAHRRHVAHVLAMALETAATA